MKKNKNKKIKCTLCQSSRLKVIYNGDIRSGLFSIQTREKYKVVKCLKCNFSFLKNPPKIDYSNKNYRKNYNKSSNIKIYSKLHNLLQKELISKIGKNSFKNKVVLDSGCGGGDFLDLVKKISKKTIGIEPSKHFHPSLKKKGHLIFGSSEEIIQQKFKADVIISFGVIEHTNDPVEYLSLLNKILRKNGKLFLITENSEDILLQLGIKKFDSFFYRTAHIGYFDSSSLEFAFKKSKFKKIIKGYWQHHDFSNALYWIKNNIPTGNKNLMNINSSTNNEWRKFLEKNSLAQMLFFSSTK